MRAQGLTYKLLWATLGSGGTLLALQVGQVVAAAAGSDSGGGLGVKLGEIGVLAAIITAWRLDANRSEKRALAAAKATEDRLTEHWDKSEERMVTLMARHQDSWEELTRRHSHQTANFAQILSGIGEKVSEIRGKLDR